MSQPENKYEIYTHADFIHDLRTLSDAVIQSKIQFTQVVGLSRGGNIPATYLSHHLDLPLVIIDPKNPDSVDSLFTHFGDDFTDAHQHLHLIVDEIADSGSTFDKLFAQFGSMEHRYRTLTLHKRYTSSYTPDFVANFIDHDNWIVYPWEKLQ